MLCVVALAFQFSLIILLNLRQSRHIWKECEELSSTRRHEDNDVDGPLRRHEISHEDHPLSLGKASLWSQYFQVNFSSIMKLLLTEFVWIMKFILIAVCPSSSIQRS